MPRCEDPLPSTSTVAATVPRGRQPIAHQAGLQRATAGPSRRLGLQALLAGWVGAGLGLKAGRSEAQPQAGLPRLAFMGFELIDEQPDPSRRPEHQRRLAMIGDLTARGLVERGLYQLVDLAPVSGLIAQARQHNEFVYRCDGCLADLAPRLGLRLVGTGWVQRVSGLILNINFQVQDVIEDRLSLTRSVDIRGDNDESWRRGVNHLLRDLAERRDRQPDYGL